MATTTLFVEILINGALATLWLLMILLRVSPLNAEQLALLNSAYATYQTPLCFTALGAFYLLGFFINTTSYWLFDLMLIRRLKRKQFGSSADAHKRMKAFVYSSAAADTIKHLEAYLVFQRVYRASFINFGLIGLQLLGFYPGYRVVGGFLVAGAALCWPLFWKVCSLDYEFLKASSAALKDNSCTKQPSAS